MSRTIDRSAAPSLAALCALAFGGCAAHPAAPPMRVAAVSVEGPAVTSVRPRAGSQVWPPGVKHFEIEWRLSTASDEDAGVVTNVELVLHAGSVTRRFGEKATGFGYMFVLEAQCGARSPGRVGELALNGGGNRVYALERRDAQNLTFSERVSSDGACGDDGSEPCPEQVDELATIDIPSGATFDERYVSIDQPGAERVERCADGG